MKRDTRDRVLHTLPGPFVMVDGSYLIYRAFYSMKPLRAPDGTPVQAVFGFCRTLKKIIEQLQPSHVMIAWDSAEQTHRAARYAAYKENRQQMPRDLQVQHALVLEAMNALGIAQYRVGGYEADDILYTAVEATRAVCDQVVLVTADKDMAQLVAPPVLLYDVAAEQIVDRAAVERKFGVPPEQLSCYFALVGDTSDSIPGVAGIGPVAARRLCHEYHTLDALYAAIDTIRPAAVQKKLRDGTEAARLSHELFTLQRCPLEIIPDKCQLLPDYWERAYPFFERLGFRSFMKAAATPHRAASPLSFAARYQYQFITIITPEQLRELCAAIRAAGSCACDTETTGLDPSTSELVGISLCYAAGSAYYIPVSHTEGVQIAYETVRTALQQLFAENQIRIICHNAQFDRVVLARNGIVIDVACDTMVAAALVLGEGERVGLKELSQRFFHEEIPSFKMVMAEGSYKNFAELPIPRATDYAAADAHQTWRLASMLLDELRVQGQLMLFEKVEMPLGPILTALTEEGIILNTAELAQIGTVVTRELEELARTIRSTAGDVAEHINLNAPRQIERLLFEELKLPPVKKTASGSYSTDAEVLEELARTHIVPALLLQYRALFKIKTTYIDALPTFVRPATGRIHAHFSQVSTATGRLSCSEPNLQNIPVERYGGSSIRDAFKAPAGKQFLSADYSQIELRVLAHLSGDAHLVSSFLHNEDIHAATAARIFGVSLTEVTHEQRQLGKRINFSILYGLTPYGLSRELRISLKEARQYIDAYFAHYPGVSAWMESVIERARNTGYVTTEWGRRRMVPGILDTNKTVYELARRVAINTVAQGTAAEIVKLGMLALDRRFAELQNGARLVLQIHDELLIAVPEAVLAETAQEVQTILESIVSWNVPLRVTTRIGANWGAVTK